MKRLHRSSAVTGFLILLSAGLLSALLANQGDISWQGVGAGGGGAWMGVKVDPNDPNHVLMGSDTGGIYLTTDGGLTWSNANVGTATDPHGDAGWYAVESFAYDPNVAGTVYAGALRGVLKSTDGGASWSTAIALRSLAVVAVDPGSPSRVYAGSGTIFGSGNNIYPSTIGGLGCIYKSSDGFATTPTAMPFTNDNPDCFIDIYNPNFVPTRPNVTSILIDPTTGSLDSRRILVSTDKGLYRRDSGTGNWSLLQAIGLPHANLGHLAFDAATGTVYVAVVTQIDAPQPSDGYFSPDSWKGGVYKSSDWGTTWSSANGVDGSDFLLNGSFEQPGLPAANWNYAGNSAYVSRILIPSQDEEDQYAIRVDTPDYNQGGNGVYSDQFAVTPGTRLTVSAWAKTSQTALKPGSCCAATFFGRLSYLSNPTTPVQGSRCNTSPWDNVFGTAELSTGWRHYESTVTVPAGATLATLSLYTNDTQGITMINKAEVRIANSLPRVYDFNGYSSSSYRALVADPTTANTLYVGTDTANYSHVDGVWKTVDGGTTWTHETRLVHIDNVTDKRANTDPVDPLNELDDTGCFTGYGYVPVYGIGIGGGTIGHDTLHMTGSFWAYRKPHASLQWEEITHDHAPGDPYPGGRTLWKARGVTNNIVTQSVKMNGSKVFLGDTDNLVQISHDAGATWRQEGIDRWRPLWALDPTINVQGGTVSSILSDTADHVFLGVKGYDANAGGVMSGCFSCSTTACTSPTGCQLPAWRWVAEGQNYPVGGGGTYLAQLSGKLFAAIQGKGLYRDDASWTSIGASLPVPFLPNDMVVDTAHGRLFVGTGDISAGTSAPSETGVFLSSNATSGSPTWCRITPAPPCTTAPCGEPVASLRVGPSGELYVGTVRTGVAGQDGGLYKATGSACSWTWTKLLTQPRLTGIALSPINSSVLYVASGQDNSIIPAQNAGIWKSVNAGSSWSHLDVNGLMNIHNSKLDYASDGGSSLVFYAATPGSGIFKATILVPATPTGLTATAVPGKKINLAWQDQSNADIGWIIERKKGVTGNWSEIFHDVPQDKVSYTNTGLSPGSTYYYRVRAYDEAGNSVYSNEASATAIN